MCGSCEYKLGILLYRKHLYKHNSDVFTLFNFLDQVGYIATSVPPPPICLWQCFTEAQAGLERVILLPHPGVGYRHESPQLGGFYSCFKNIETYLVLVRSPHFLTRLFSFQASGNLGLCFSLDTRTCISSKVGWLPTSVWKAIWCSGTDSPVYLQKGWQNF